MNICFLIGEINSEVDFNFFFNCKKHISVASCYILLKENMEEEIKIIAYDKNADKLYSQYKIGSTIIIEGTLINNYVEVIEIYEC